MAYIAEYSSGRSDGAWFEVYVRHAILVSMMRPNCLEYEIVFEAEIEPLWINKGLSYAQKIKLVCEFLEKKGFKKTSERHTGNVG